MDSVLGYLTDKMKDIGSIDLILLSDHGNISTDKKSKKSARFSAQRSEFVYLLEKGFFIFSE